MFSQEEISAVLLETISEAVIIVDNHQKIMEINTSAEKIFNYSKEEIIGKDLNLLLPSNYHHDHSIHFEEFIKTGKRKKMSETTNVFGLKKDGDIFELEIELIPFSIYSKTFVMALINDISQRKEIEKSLMIKNRALESATNGIIITDALKYDNPVIFSNTAFEELTGYSSNEILNHNCRFLYGTDVDQEPLKKLRKAIDKGESCQVILRNYKKDGTLFWNELYIIPIKNSNGLATNFIGILQDITERKREEEEHHYLSEIFNESLNEIYVFDAKTLKFLKVNYGAQKNIGYSIEELVNMTPLDIKINKNEIEFRNTIDLLLKKNVEKLEFESIHQRKDGTTYPVEVHLQLSTLGEREVFVAIILDITERKDYTTKLENKVEERTQQLKTALNKELELNELKTKFLSLVSNEFKTPLTGILTSSLLLSKYQLTEQQEKRDKHIKRITEKVNYLTDILDGYLSIEKFEEGKLSYKYSNFKLSKVVKEVVFNSLMLLKQGQQIKYPENIEDDKLLYQDEKIVELILSNLMHNAIKYSPENSTIYLDVKQDSKSTTFKIIDSGFGIPEKDQNRIFERYFRADNVINTEGAGIGLNIVKNHLEFLGGSISFESQENIGTTFTVVFPNNIEI